MSNRAGSQESHTAGQWCVITRRLFTKEDIAVFEREVTLQLSCETVRHRVFETQSYRKFRIQLVLALAQRETAAAQYAMALELIANEEVRLEEMRKAVAAESELKVKDRQKGWRLRKKTMEDLEQSVQETKRLSFEQRPRPPTLTVYPINGVCIEFTCDSCLRYWLLDSIVNVFVSGPRVSIVPPEIQEAEAQTRAWGGADVSMQDHPLARPPVDVVDGRRGLLDIVLHPIEEIVPAEHRDQDMACDTDQDDPMLRRVEELEFARLAKYPRLS